jgi:hypothetical protein
VLEDLELSLFAAIPVAQAVAASLPLPDAILLDVGHEYTEVALAEAGALSGLTSMEMGGLYFTQVLARALSISMKHAEVLKQESARNDMSRVNRPVGRVLTEGVLKWRQALEQKLLELAGGAPLPPRIYLYGSGAQLPLLIDELRGQPWTRRLPFRQYPHVERLHPHQLRGLFDPRGLMHSTAHTALAALAAWGGHEPTPLQRHLDGVTRALAPSMALL